MQNSNKPKVLIITVNYNGKMLLEKHLPSISKTSYPHDLVVVDNGSADESVAFLKSKFPSARVIKMDKNTGFARANNAAFRQFPDYDFYALINNDMNVEPDWLGKLVDIAEKDAKVAAVGSKILYADKKFVNSAGLILDKHFNAYERLEGESDSNASCGIEEVEALSGGAILLRRKALDEVGLFDEKMFLYYEDVDLCLRLKDKGWKLIYNGNSVVYHDHMGTSGDWGSTKRNLMTNKNRILSIIHLKGIMVGIWEAIRFPFDWLFWKIRSRFNGKTYKQWMLSKSGKKS